MTEDDNNPEVAPQREIPDLSNMRLKLFDFGDIKQFKFQNEAAVQTEAQKLEIKKHNIEPIRWGIKLRQMRHYIGTLSDAEAAAVEPLAWHLIMASCAKLHSIEAVEGVDLSAYAKQNPDGKVDSISYLKMLEDHVVDVTGKEPPSLPPSKKDPLKIPQGIAPDNPWLLIAQRKQRAQEAVIKEIKYLIDKKTIPDDNFIEFATRGRYPFTDITDYITRADLKSIHSTRSPLKKKEIDNAVGQKPLFLPITSKGVLFGFTEYAIVSLILKNKVQAAVDQDQAVTEDKYKEAVQYYTNLHQSELANMFGYANLADLDDDSKDKKAINKTFKSEHFDKNEKDKFEIEVDVKVIPPVNINEIIEQFIANGDTAHASLIEVFLIEDEVGTGNTINDILEWMKRKLLDELEDNGLPRYTDNDIQRIEIMNIVQTFFTNLRINLGETHSYSCNPITEEYTDGNGQIRTYPVLVWNKHNYGIGRPSTKVDNIRLSLIDPKNPPNGFKIDRKKKHKPKP